MSATKHDVETVLDAIKGEGVWGNRETLTNSFGNITTIAKRLGVSRPTIYTYMKKWATVKNAIEEEKETAKDIVENRIMKRIIEGSDVMTIFYAKTQMKDRGYIEKQEFDHSGSVESTLIILPPKGNDK